VDDGGGRGDDADGAEERRADVRRFEREDGELALERARPTLWEATNDMHRASGIPEVPFAFPDPLNGPG
jgi:hypothetical protein